MALAAVLKRQGFTIDARTGQNATRDGILAGYAKLIADTNAGDVAVFGYSGHGALTIDSTGRATTMFQNIVPFDYADSTDDDYRGISALELSLLLRMLVEKSRNAIVILDCCHSAQMSRDGAVRDAAPRALPSPLRVSVDAYHEALRARYPGVDIAPQGNTEAIKLVACAREQVAYEYTNANDVRTGAFTEALVEVLEDVADVPMTWGLIGRAVRERVLRRFPSQRPDFDGPVKRQLFELVELDANDGVVPLIKTNTEYKIGAGQIHAVNVGDVYGVAGLASRDRIVTQATVTKVAPTTATVQLAGAALPDDPIAIPMQRAAAPRLVTVLAPADRLPMISDELARARTIRAATGADGELTLATLRMIDDGFAIEDGRGMIFPPTKHLADAVMNLANLAVAQSLRELVGEHGIASTAIECELGLLVSGERRSLPESGAAISCGDQLYCRVVNRSPSALYVHAFSVGLRGSVTALSSNEKLQPGDELFVGNPRGQAP
ncbi:MAG TPA: caspase family protein, partial [Kofleriaceae bacterium]|nr:caspase family protein [Kofleriaceae bacterium]